MVRFQLVSSIFLLAVVCNSALAQWLTLDGEVPVNPDSGAILNPRFFYDASTGDFSIENAGPNGVVDSPSNDSVGGDDIGIISFSISYREDPGSALQPTLPVFADGIAWSPPTVMDGELQVTGLPLFTNSIFLPINRYRTPLFNLAAGTGVQGFASSENEIVLSVGLGVRFGEPGMTIVSVGDPQESGALFWGHWGTSPDNTLDGRVDCMDLDAIYRAIRIGGGFQTDVNLDGVMDFRDVEYWLQFPHQNDFSMGDANLDGVVDTSDFNIWNENRFTEVDSWCSGDFNADGVVDGSDFNIWNENKFTSANDVATVPEPGLSPLFGLVLILLIRGKRSLHR